MYNLKIPVVEIISFLGNDVIGVFGKFDDVYIKYLREPKDVDISTLDWVNSAKINKQEMAESSLAKVLIVDQDVSYSENILNQNKVLIQVISPRLAISLVAQQFFVPTLIPGIHPTATIDSEAVVSCKALIGASSVLGKCKIGKGTVIHPNVTISDNVIIGENCIIHSGVVVGTDGLGCQRLADGTLIKFPHLGGVHIGNNVEIGANSQIAKGALSNTIIGNGVKINGLCFIAHNCIVEENVWMTGNSMLAGSVKVEKNVTIFSSVTIRDNCVIGKGSVIGMGSVVINNVPAGETWFGNPAKKNNNER